MKKITLFLLSCVLLATACTQSGTNPTPPPTPNPCGFSTLNTQYIELIVNGITLRSETIMLNGVAVSPVTCIFNTDTSSGGGRTLQLMGSTTTCSINSTMINNLAIHLAVDKQSNYANPLGIYDQAGYANFSYYTNITNQKDYQSDSLTVTVTSCTADYVSGTFVGTAKEINTNIIYPITGSFSNTKRNGF